MEISIEALQVKYLELETLLDFTNNLNSFENTPDLLQEILVKSCGVLNASAGFILLEDSNTDILNIEAHFNINITPLRSIIFNKKKGFVYDIKSIGKTVCLDIDSNVHLSKINAKYAIIAPLQQKKDIIGFIVLLDKESRKGLSAFDDSDSSMISAIASQASTAYSNIQLLEKIQQAKSFNDNVMESIATGVITTNLFGEINHINLTAEKILNKDRASFIGHHYGFVFDQNELLINLLLESESALEFKSESNLILDFHGKKTAVNISMSPLLNDQQQHIGTVIAMEDLSNLDKLKSTFQKYVSKQIVDQILINEDLLNLGGQEQEVTILFTDIRGFTAMSEKMVPNEVVDTLNDYFNQMIEVIFKYNGTLDKIIGDALMVVFGAPLPDTNDADNALLTAVEMQEKLVAFNQNRIINGKLPVEIGIGINRGKVISGNIGSSQQMNYTVIGDAVNLASRLCSAAKVGEIIISNSVWENTKEKKKYNCQKLTPIKVKGKTKPIAIRSIQHKKNTEITYLALFEMLESFQTNNIPTSSSYHNIHHIKSVVDAVKFYGKKEQVSKQDLLYLQLAAWLHDIGFVWSPVDHEKKGCEYAKTILTQLGFSVDIIEKINGMIMATKIPQSPKNLLEKIICDADLDYIGKDNYAEISGLLLKEISLKNTISEIDWLVIQKNFLESHTYFTKTANKLRTKNKNKIIVDITNKIALYHGRS